MDSPAGRKGNGTRPGDSPTPLTAGQNGSVFRVFFAFFDFAHPFFYTE
jgi:hypothetical protein